VSLPSDDFCLPCLIDHASIVVDDIGVVTTFIGKQLPQLYRHYQLNPEDLSSERARY
jgi:hypothetical protein